MKRIFLLNICLLLLVFLTPPFFGLSTPTHAESDPPGAAASLPVTAPDPDEDDALPASASAAASLPDARKDAATLTLASNDQVETLTLSEYLAGVVAAEMPASFPLEALKAQAVAARTYTLYKQQLRLNGLTASDTHPDADVCDDPAHCKAYTPLAVAAASLWGDQASSYEALIRQAVAETDGQILTYDGAPIAAVFHANAPGMTENAVDVWGGEAPYLVSVDSPGYEDDPNYENEVTYSADEFRKIFLATCPDADLSGPPREWFKASERTEAGSVKTVAVGGVRVKGSMIRSLCSLKSSNFTLSCTDDSITFHTVGRGHGVGMSQYGARALAQDGENYEQILLHYYTGVALTAMP